MKRALGIDHGEARIGLAISDELGMLAHALETVHIREIADPVAHIARHREGPGNWADRPRAAAQHGRKLRARRGKKCAPLRRKLRAGCACELKLWDERLTSVAAQRSLHEAGRNVKNSRAVIDQVAAQMILQGLARFAGHALSRSEDAGWIHRTSRKR